jgi:two-component system invasion response regulator UvrY
VTESKAKRLLIVDDHSIVIVGVKLILKQKFPEIGVEGLSDANEVLKLISEKHFDVIILDINMAGVDTISLTSEILRHRPDTKILIYSTHSEDHYAKRFLKLGVAGYLSKEAPNEELIRAVELLIQGKKYVSNQVEQKILREIGVKNSDNVFELLSDREVEVTRLLLRGYSSKQMSQILNLHTSTIGTYKTRIMEKLDITNIIDLKNLATLYHFDI